MYFVIKQARRALGALDNVLEQAENALARCENCGKIYWEGTHPKRFREKLGNIIKQI